MGLGRGEPNLSRLDVLVSFYNDRCCSGGHPWCEFVDGDYSICGWRRARIHHPYAICATVAMLNSTIRIVRVYLIFGLSYALLSRG